MPKAKGVRKRPAAASLSGDDGVAEGGAAENLPAGIASVRLHSVEVFEPQPDVAESRGYLDSESFDLKGTELLASWIYQTIQKMPQHHRVAVLKQFERSGRTLGTLCSGTESPVLVYNAFSIAAEKLKSQFDFKHVFSCDKNVKVQSFIRSVFGDHVPKLFSDTADVASKDRVAPDVLQAGRMSAVPTARELIAGFPCKDVSSLLVGAHRNRDIIKASAARTGGVFGNILEYLSEHDRSLAANLGEGAMQRDGEVVGLLDDIAGHLDPTGVLDIGVESLILENVVGLSAKGAGQRYTNLDWCVALLEAKGFWVFVAKLDPRMLGMPVSRQRLWFVAIKMGVLTSHGMTGDRATELAKEITQGIVTGQPQRRLSDYLLPEDHPALKIAAAAVDRSAASSKAKAKAKLPEWPVKYAAYVDEQPILQEQGSSTSKRRKSQPSGPKRNWWDPVHPPPGITSAFPHLQKLSDYHFSILAAHGIDVVTDEGMQARSDRTIELSQSLERTRCSKPGEASIILPGGRLYLESRGRCAVGHEALLLQGLHFADGHGQLANFSSDDLQALAGNAFNSYCLATMVVVRETLLGISRFDQRSTSASSAPSASSEGHVGVPIQSDAERRAAAWRKAKAHSLADILSFG